MGDKEGAREILDEVVAEGDDSQKRAARDLLATLS
jgi:pilus assembly protein FimV